MKYIKKFDTLSAQTEYLNSADIDTYVGYVEDNETVYYDDALPNYAEQYLTFDIISAGTINYTGDTIYYSLDNGATWSATDGTSISVSAGDKVLWKGSHQNYGDKYSPSKFSGSTATFNIEGNIMSLIYGDNFIGQTTLPSTYTFSRIFMELKIVSARNLILPATTLTEGCYYMMFGGATLTTAPTLPAATLVENCYQFMFDYATSLNYIKCLATDISAKHCTLYWLRATASNGTFVKAASMNDWTTGVNGIPNNWTIENE